MKKINRNHFVLVVVVFLFFATLQVAFSTSGACSYHGGVDCSRGRQINGKVYCNDGWTESMASYDFMVMCEAEINCTAEEWSSLSKKYGLEDLLFKMQDTIEKMSTDTSWKTLYDALDVQYKTAMSLADSDCNALGADRASQIQYHNSVIERARDELDRLEQEERELTENYLRALNDLNQSTCLPNSTYLSDGKCACNEGYIFNGTACATYTQNCQSEYGEGSYGDKNGCYCYEGYALSSSKNACSKIKTTLSPQTLVEPIKDRVEENTTSEFTKSVLKNIESKNKSLQKFSEDNKEERGLDEISKLRGQGNTAKSEEKGFVGRIVDSIKNFFLGIFR